MDTSESILLTYVDLDKLIELAGLSRSERAVVELMMRGWTVSDISLECGQKLGAIDTLFRRAVRKITKTNNCRWEEFYCAGDKTARRRD